MLLSSKVRLRNSSTGGGADADDLVQFPDDVDSKLMLGAVPINEAERENLMRELQRECKRVLVGRGDDRLQE